LFIIGYVYLEAMGLEVLEELFEFEKESGYSEEELRQAEKKFSIQLPSLLKELYLKYGKEDVLNGHNFLVPPSHWYVSPEGYFSFFIENQAVCGWWIKFDSGTGLSNGEVFCSFDDICTYQDAPDLEHFWVKLGFSYSIVLFAYRWKARIKKEEEQIIIQHFGKAKTEAICPNYFESRYYWTDLKYLVSTYKNRNGELFISIVSKQSSFETIQNILPDTVWCPLRDETHLRSSYRHQIDRYRENEDSSVSTDQPNTSQTPTAVDDDLPF
jgi:hypothetical protein